MIILILEYHTAQRKPACIVQGTDEKAFYVISVQNKVVLPPSPHTSSPADGLSSDLEEIPVGCPDASGYRRFDRILLIRSPLLDGGLADHLENNNENQHKGQAQLAKLVAS